MRSPIEIEVAMEPRRHLATRLIVLNLTIILMKRALFVPSTLTLISNPISQQPLTLLISFDYLPELISEFLTLSIMDESHHGWQITDGESTAE